MTIQQQQMSTHTHTMAKQAQACPNEWVRTQMAAHGHAQVRENRKGLQK